MSKVMLKDLPERFEEIESRNYGGIEQSIGGMLIKPRSRDQSRNDLITEIRSMCGGCFGAHLAEMAGTEAHYSSPSHLNITASRKSVREKLAKLRSRLFRMSNGRKVGFRSYRDGAERLAKLVAKGTDFKEWHSGIFKRKKPHIPQMSVLSQYLHERCGAPERPFNSDKWSGTKPSRVLRRILELNPNIAEETL